MNHHFKLEKAKKLPKERIGDFIRLLMENFDRVVAPVKKGKNAVFKEIDNPEEVVLNYTRTVLPPKRFILKYRR